MKLVNAETLAEALHASFMGGPGGCLFTADASHRTFHESDAAAILAAIPPDPRLDALLAAARELLDLIDRRVDFGAYMSDDAKADALRDALAAFEEGT